MGFLPFQTSEAAAAGLLASTMRAMVVIFGSVGPLACLFPFFSGGPVGWARGLAWGESICVWWGGNFLSLALIWLVASFYLDLVP